ncbi:MAG: hypothetical protein J2P37_22450 [Ktedonobacteraceae bacterium]|nr:hypothetical protein [Ktedonobacteraceae bacterium]
MGSAIPFLVFLLVIVVMVGGGMCFCLFLYTRGVFRSRRFASVPVTERVPENIYMSLGATERPMSETIRRVLLAIMIVLVSLSLLLSMMITGGH